MIKEITAKTILNSVGQPDTWFGLKYNMNLYRGCQHRCIYCDSRSLCYGIDSFDKEILVKVNAVDLLREALPRKRVVGTIGTGSMNDPYMSIEKQFNLTGQVLEVIAENRFPVHIITKSDLVLKDIDTLAEINRVYAAISFTVTTADDELCRLVEPGSPRSFQCRAFNAHIESVWAMSPLTLTADTTEDLTTMEYRDVVVSGRFDYPNQVALRNMYSNGQYGYHLLTPLVMEAGVAVIVDRGWIPA